MIRLLLDLYCLVLVADFIISFVPSLKYQPWSKQVHKVSEFTCKPIRQLLPPDLPLDFSPFVVIVGINILKILW